MSEQLQRALENFGTKFEEFKETNDKRLAEVEKYGTALSETVEKLSKIELSMDAEKERIREIEADLEAARFDNQLQDQLSDEEHRHKDAWDRWLRDPKNGTRIAELKEAALQVETMQKHRAESRQMAVTITTTGGGNAIPTEVASRMEQKIYDLSPIRRIANVQRASNENLRFVVVDNNATGGWAAAGGTRSETTTPLFQGVTLTYGTAYAYPQVYEEAMNDIAFDVGMFVENVSAEVLAQQEGVAFVSGNGTAKPTGFLNTTEVTTGDEVSPARTFGVLQYFPTGAAGAFQSDPLTQPGPSPAAGDPAGCLFDCAYALKAEYRANATWVMAKATVAAIRKFRDKDGNYLYLPGLVAGQPDTLLGYPIMEAEAMPAIAADSISIAFGDFNRGYQIADIIATLRVTVDDNITAPGFVKFYVRRRVGGNILNDDAIKVIKFAAS